MNTGRVKCVENYAKNYLAPELKKASRLIGFLTKEYGLDDDEIN